MIAKVIFEFGGKANINNYVSVEYTVCQINFEASQ